MNALLERLVNGDVRALARVITQIENREESSFSILRELFGKTGNAQVLGVTGSPGSGKSTLIDKLAERYRQSGRQIGIIAVDPSSPYTGGAILGDRIRMKAADSDAGIYIRSTATRGYLGGLASTTNDIVTVMDAAGRDPVIIETVGVGQDEIDIARLADISIVVLVPGQGDDIQALKAGIMEIGDIFVINKCDQPGAAQMERALQAVLDLAPSRDWHPPIVKVTATEGTGIGALMTTIEDCHAQSSELPSRIERKRQATKERLVRLLEEHLVQTALKESFSADEIDATVDAIFRREKDPYSVVEEILERTSFRRSL